MKIEDYLKLNHTASTAKRYLREIEAYQLQVLHHQTATHQDVANYLGALRKQYPNPQTLKTSLYSIKKYYQWLLDTRQREDHPCRYLKLRDRRKERQLQDLFTTEELEKLLERKERYQDLKLRNQLIISLLIYQGLTTGELVRLELQDVALEKAELYIKSSRTLNSRTLPLKPRQIMLLHQYLQELRPKLLASRKESGAKRHPDAISGLIINKRGNPETGEQISYLVSTFKELYPDRNINPRTIRQSVIANLLKQGHDLRVVQVYAGHKYPSSTEAYKQSQTEELKAAVLKHHPLQ